MNTTVERLPECKATMHVQLPAERVTEEREKIIKAYSKQAKIPGYRPGKVPSSVIEKRFQKQITEEVEDRMIQEGIREGIKQENLKIIEVTSVTDQNLNVDGSFTFLAEMLMAPEIELPDYSAIPVKAPPSEITDEQLNGALEELRQRFADFNDIEDRSLDMDDFAILDYEGKIDGQRVGAVAPSANAQVAQNSGFWLKMDAESFFPGFCEQLVGANKDESRDVTVTVPDDYPVEELKGKEIIYSVKITGMKEQVLPEVDDAFAEKLLPGKTLDDVKETLKLNMGDDRTRRIEEAIRNQIVDYLNVNSNFEVPQDLVKQETQNRVNNIVQENAKRGISDDEIQKNQQEIIDNANQQAETSVRASFILQKIAEKEELKVTQEQMMQRIAQIASQQKKPIKKMIKELQKNNALGNIQNSILISSTLDFLREKVNVEIIQPDAAEAAE
jgi:trigger factor